MLSMKSRLALFAGLLCGLLSAGFGADYVSIRGTRVVARVLEVASDEIKSDLDIDFTPHTTGTSAEAIYYMANGGVDIAITPRRMTAQEQAAKPDKHFTETVVGVQSLAIIVSDELWKGGVQALTKEQLRAIYEGDIKNWNEVGGPNRAITFFNRSSTNGVWDLYMLYLYGDVRKGPLSNSEKIDGPEELKGSVQFTRGSYSVLEFAYYKEGEGLHALGLKQPDGTVIDATLANIANGTYEMQRPLVFSVNRQPIGKVRDLLEYLMAPKGQAFVRKAGDIAQVDIDAEKKKPK